MYGLTTESPLISSRSESRLRLSLYPDLFKQSCLDTYCHFFFMSSNFMELDHLCLLVLHLLLDGGKHLEKLVALGGGSGSAVCIPSDKAVLE